MTILLPALDKLLAARAGEAGGHVWLVGAGPGDAELLTVKALRLISSAEVVIYDRLVSEEILALIPSAALCIDVGKQPGSHAMAQTQINQLLVELAAAGQQVIRLKGGDPFIFGRGGEEMLALKEAGIACDIVPGITAATGCAAATGIPLTHRGLAQSVRFITGHGQLGLPQLEWQSLRDPRQTLVFYMGLTWCEALSENLRSAGRRANTPVAIIERGTRPDQRVITTTLEQLAKTAAHERPQSPALMIVGDVVALYEATSTFTPSASKAAIDCAEMPLSVIR